MKSRGAGGARRPPANRNAARRTAEKRCGKAVEALTIKRELAAFARVLARAKKLGKWRGDIEAPAWVHGPGWQARAEVECTSNRTLAAGSGPAAGPN